MHYVKCLKPLSKLCLLPIKIVALSVLIFGVTTVEKGIAQNSITVYSPSSTTAYAPGDQMSIGWLDNFDPNHVGINLLDDSGNIEVSITEFTSNTGSYTWNIPTSMASGNYQIEVFSAFELCMMGNPGCGNYVRGDVDDVSATFPIQTPEITVSAGYDNSTVEAGEDFY